MLINHLQINLDWMVILDHFEILLYPKPVAQRGREAFGAHGPSGTFWRGGIFGHQCPENVYLQLSYSRAADRRTWNQPITIYLKIDTSWTAKFA